jgi:hypothetical protein
LVNEEFRHPDSETLSHIRTVRKDSTIVATNICGSCLAKDDLYDKELHTWYDDYVSKSNLPVLKKHDAIIVQMLEQAGMINEPGNVSPAEYGLLAYIFEIPLKPEEKIKMKIAVSKNIPRSRCFYNQHAEKINPEFCKD